MSADYYTLVTDIGHARLTTALALGQAVTLTHFALGDGNGAVYDPVQTQTALAREVYRAPINSIRVDPANPTWLTVEAVVPATVGGWTVREAGIFDADGTLIAIAKYPESVKPALTAGIGKDLYCRLILQHTNVTAVTLKVDPSVILVTKKELDTSLTDHATGKTHRHPDATTEVKGFTRYATTKETVEGRRMDVAVTPAGLTAVPKPPPPPSATATIQGLSRFATVAEALAGWVGDAAVTPEGLLAKVKEGWAHKIEDASSWWRLPNGLILQAGWAWAGGTPGQVGWNIPCKRTLWMSFPLAFPTNVISASVVAHHIGVAATIITVTGSTATGMNLAATCATDASVWWIAIGI